jgi:hypothetical protein
MWGAVSDDRAGLSFTTATRSSSVYNLGTDRIEKTASKNSSIIARLLPRDCPSIAEAGACLCFP